MEMSQKEDIAKLGRKIRAIIVEKGLTVYDVAHDARLDPNNLRKYIRGDQEMKITTFVRIIKALKVDSSELLNDI